MDKLVAAISFPRLIEVTQLLGKQPSTMSITDVLPVLGDEVHDAAEGAEAFF